MNTMTALWSEKLFDQFKANTSIGRSMKIHELRGMLTVSLAGQHAGYSTLSPWSWCA